MKSSFTLLKTLLKATSLVNIYRYTTDKKKKGRIAASFIGLSILFVMLLSYGIAMCVGYGASGLSGSVPATCALTICALACVFTFIKTNGYLFNFKEYDMLMSLPFEARTVAGCKFLYMYLKSLPWYLTLSVSMLIGYAIFEKPPVYTYVLWLVLSLFLPVIPMVAAAFLGFLIAKISSGFRKSNLIQTVITFIFIISCFSIRFIIESVVRNDEVADMMKQASEAIDKAAAVYPPADWFADAVRTGSISGALFLIFLSTAIFAVVFVIVGKSYRKINSAMTSHAASGNYTMRAQKSRSVLNAIAFKEFRRMTGSTVYMTNACVGEIMSVLLGGAVLVVGFDKLVALITQNAPFNPAILHPAIPLVVYFLLGMISTTAFTPSLEGKNYWILQSLPVDKKTVFRGKMLYNMYLTVPFMIFGTLCMCISAGISLVDTVLYLLYGFVLCAFSTAWGCVCGVKHMRLDWENEVEVIKQGAAVAIYLFSNMVLSVVLIFIVIFLSTKMDIRLLSLIQIAVVTALAVLSYMRVMSLAK